MKSVITCDREGRIETFSEGAVALFGYRAEEVVGKRRVSLFSPGHVVLEHVPRWLATADEKGEFETDTVFVRRDGSRFAARIKITPTFKKGEPIGYCGVTIPLDDKTPEAVAPPISLGTRIFAALVVTRAPFLSATLMPLLLGLAFVGGSRGLAAIDWTVFALAAFGAIALHIAANVLNDYFDYTSGTDDENNDYFLPFSGGSRAIELGLITPPKLLAIGVGALLVGAAAGVGLYFLATPHVLAFGALGAFAAVFYTAPPLRLVARRGLGELLVGLSFGAIVVGTVLVLAPDLAWAGLAPTLWAAVPVGLLTSAILYINEFPDAESDVKTGKNHLVVTLGKRGARFGYGLQLAAAYGAVVAGVAVGALAQGALLALLSLPLAVAASVILWRHYLDRSLVRANKLTIALQAVFSLLLAGGLAFL